MDIQGLVNHNLYEDRGNSSLSPLENSGSDSARSQYPADTGMLQSSSYSLSHRDRHEIPSPKSHIHSSTDQTNSQPIKRPLDTSSPPTPMASAKRRSGETNGENGKSFPTRRRALQACEGCRAKKSKCDNERPSCGSCIQHGVECIYKGTPFVPA